MAYEITLMGYCETTNRRGDKIEEMRVTMLLPITDPVAEVATITAEGINGSTASDTVTVQ